MRTLAADRTSILSLRRKVRARFVMAALAVLILSQILSGVLTVSAIRKTAFDATATAVRIVGHDWAFRIQNSLSFGKPITQMFGLSELLADIRSDLPFLSGVLVTLPDGSVVESNVSGDVSLNLVETILSSRSRNLVNSAPGSAIATASVKFGDMHVFILPVAGAKGTTAGTLTMLVPDAVVTNETRRPVDDAMVSILLATVIGAAGIVCGAFLIGGAAEARSERWKLLLIPAIVLVTAQGLSSWRNIITFRDTYVQAATVNVERSVDRFGQNLQRLVGKGVNLERLSDYESPFRRMSADIPELAMIDIQTADGRRIAGLYVGREGKVDTEPRGGAGRAPIERDIQSADGTAVIARLNARLSDEAIAEGVRRRVLDAGTVLLTSALFGFELLVLFGILMRRLTQPPSADATDHDRHHLLARPASFLLVFGWALPLSFVPLQMGALASTPLFGLSKDVTMALPISVEMGCALVTALIAGMVTDRRGWHIPFLLGSVVCAAGAFAAMVATVPIAYIGARALVGLGYGLAWMGIQGYVFTWSSPRTRTQGIANLVAGIFAGQICGNVTGAMLADQIGFSSVFLLAAIAGLLPIPFAFLFMRPYFGRPTDGTEQTLAARPATDGPLPVAMTARPGSNLAALLMDRNFLALLLLSVVPFSVAQVGLLYYTLPVYLSQQGVEQADIGRIMMIYGLSVIYIAPSIGRLVDRHARKKPFIVLGGFVGGAGLAFTYFDVGIVALVTSVFLLGLASSLGGPAQSSFALHLPSVQRLGTGRAMGIQRAADKLGQMIGPVAVGTLFAVIGTKGGLAVTGVYYLGCTLLFLMIARDHVDVGSRSRVQQSA